MIVNKRGICLGSKNGRLKLRRLTSMTVALIFTCCLLTLRCTSGSETNASRDAEANAIVRKMVLAYQSAQTFEETSEAKITESGKGEYIQQTLIRFKHPNLFYLSSEDPKIGTYRSYCDGNSITIYSGMKNSYTKRNSSIDLRGTLKKLSDAGKALMNISVVQMLSPIGFVGAKGMPDECKQFQFVRTEMLEGAKVTVVTGQADETFLRSLGAPDQTNFKKKKLTLWIDREHYLLRKAKFEMQWHMTTKATPTKPAQSEDGEMSFEEKHHNPRLNTPLRDEDFIFIAPKGAEESFQDKRVGRAKNKPMPALLPATFSLDDSNSC